MMAEIVLAFVVGSVFGALVMVAWVFDDPKVSEREPTEGGVWPL
jgi:hypothetical protein